MHYERPFLVGLVCWVLIIGNMHAIYTTMKGMGDPSFAASLHIYPYSASIAEFILFSTMAVPLVCGICLYEQQGWARFVYIAVMVPYFIQSFFTVTQPSVPISALYLWGGKFLLYVVSIVILFLPAARYYYTPPQYLDGD